MTKSKLLTNLLLATVSMAGVSLSHAAIVAIDSVTLGGSNELLTATVGGTAYSGGVVAELASDNRNGSMGTFSSISPLTAGSTAPAGTLASSSETTITVNEQGYAIDNNVLTGVAGAVSDSVRNGGALNLQWGVADGGFTDNDADPDFFVFEDLGNDSVVVHAILSNGTVGVGIALSGWNTVSSAGTLYNAVPTALTGRTVSGVAFDFTDLKDASGANLTNGTTIKGIVIGDTSQADFYEVYANVAAIPEPSSLLLGSFGLLFLLRRRR